MLILEMVFFVSRGEIAFGDGNHDDVKPKLCQFIILLNL